MQAAKHAREEDSVLCDVSRAIAHFAFFWAKGGRWVR